MTMSINGNRYLWLGLGALLIAGFLVYGMVKPNTSKEESGSTATTTVSTTTGSASTGKPSGSTATKPAVQTNTLVKIEYRGGACLNGKTCYDYKTITKNAQYYKNGEFVTRVNAADVTRLIQEIEKADWKEILAQKYIGQCQTPTRQEITYTFYTSKGTQVISNCTTVIDFTHPLFKLIPIILPPGY